MFETKEEYSQAFADLITDEQKESFIQKFGDGNDLPTQAEKAVTQVETPEQAAEPVIPVTEDSPVPDFLPEEAEPASEEDIEQYAEYMKEEKNAINMGKIERNIQARKEQYALRDDEGNMLYDPETGEVMEREVSTGEMMLNSIDNMLADTKSGMANMGIGVNEVVQRVVGDEALEEWAEDADSDFLRAFTDEGSEELIRQAELAESERDEHTGTYTEGANQNIAAAFVNSVTSIGSSAVINTMTLGGGLPMMFMGDFYRSYNDEVATEKGKSLAELREDGEDSFWAPAAFGIVAGLSERFGLKGAGKAITSKLKGPIAKKVAHRLLSGNKEGLTELFQTGLELANTAHAKGEDATEAFIDGVASQDGLEAYLQGFTGGATLAGKGQDQKKNIKKVNRAIQSMRAPVDSRKIDQLTAKGVELRQALSFTTDPEAKKLIQDQINETTKELKYVIPQANGVVRKMTDPQIEQANKYWEQMDQVNKQKQSLLDKFKAGEITIESYKPAREALDTKAAKITEKTSKLKDQAEQQPNLREKDMETPSPSGVWHTSVKGKIDEIASDKSNVWDILQNKDVKKFVESKVRQQWKNIPDDIKAQTTFDDVVGDVMFGGSQKSQSLLGLLQSYDAEGKAKASTYVLKPLEQKILGVIQDQTGQKKGRSFESKLEAPTEEGAGIQVADEDASVEAVLETENQKKDINTPVIANRLGFSPGIAETAKAEAQQFVENNQQFEGDKKLEQNASKFFRDKLKNQIQKEMGKKDDYFKYLTNNAEQLIKALPNKALALRRDESQAWVEQKPTPQEFVQYMRSGNETKKKRALAELLADTIGLRAAKDFIESNPELNAIHEAEVKQETVNAANQIQETNEPGSFYTQFQDSTQIADDDFAAQNKATDKVLQEKGLGKTIDTKNNQQFEEGRKWVSETLTKYFPREFFQQGMFANAGLSAQKRGFFFTSAKELEENVTNAKSDPNSVWNKTGRYVYGTKSIENIKKNWGKIQENNKNNWAAFENMWNTFGKMYADDNNNARFISAILKSAQNSQNHISRTAAGLIAYSESQGIHGRFEEEHSLPQSAVSRYLMQTMIEGGDMNQALANVKRNFFQVALNKDDDSKLKKPGVYNYASKMPDGWKMSDNTWARYFNSNVNNNNGGINPNSITFFETGKTVAETFGAGVPKRIGAEFAVPTGKRNAAGGFDFDGGFGKRVGAEFRFNPVIKAQQEVVTEKVGDQVEQNFDKVINGLNKLLGERGALQANIAAIPVNVLIGGLRAAKLAYRGSRDLVKAVEAGYNKVSDWMSRQEWADFTAKAIREVKNEQTPADKQLVFASKKAVELEQQRQQTIQKANKAGLDLDPNTSLKDAAKAIADNIKANKEKKSNIQQEFDDQFAKKKITKLGKIANEIFVGSNAEDFKGLMYRLFPGGDMNWMEDKLLNPYIEGVEKFKSFKTTANRQFAAAGKALGRKRILNTTLKDLKDENAPQDIKAFAEGLKEIDGGKFFDSLTGDNDIPSQMVDYLRKTKRKEYIGEFINNSNAAFRDSKGNIRKEISDRLGDSYASSLDNMLTRMVSGVNRQQYSSGNKEAQRVLDLVNESNSIVMQWNMRSGFLQAISALNYMRESGTSIFNAKQNLESLKTIWASDYMKERWGTGSFALEANEIIEGKKTSKVGQWYKAMIKAGFLPTKAMDAIAIATGGAPYYTAMLKKHKGDEKLAMRDFVKFTEENQQSSDPSKISKLQAGSLGRLMFAFLNTPFQYARLSKRAIQDIRAGRGTVAGNVSKLGYYTFVQSAAFSMLQNLFNMQDLFNWFDDEEDEEDFKVGLAIDGWINTNLKTLGSYGAIASWVRDIYNEFDKQQEEGKPSPEKLALAATKVSPPLNRKLTDLKKISQYLYKQNRGKLDEKVKAVALAGDVLNLPTYRAYQKIENLAALADEDRSAIDKIWKGLGYSDFAVGEPKDDWKEDSWEEQGWEEEGWEDSPFNKLGRGEMGQAHKDGTIEVDPNLSPEEKAKTIAHEKQHVKDMKERGLNYDDNYIYFDDKRFARKNGKIRHSGEWKKEGDKSLPWEERAYAAENGSPLKNIDDDKKKKNPYQTIKDTETEYRDLTEAQAQRYGWEDKSNQDVRLLPVEGGTRGSVELGGRFYKPGYVGDVSNYKEFEHGPEHFEAAREWTKDWESNPITIQKDIARTGATEEELHHSLDRQRKATVKNKEGRETVAATYDPRTHQIADNPKFKQSEGYGNESVMAHEFAHAGRDLERGLHVKDLIGSIPVAEFNDPTGEFKEYVNRPHEMYGFLQQLRHDLGVKPGQQMTPEQLKAAKKAGNKNPFLNVPVKKIIEVNDKVAYQNNKPSLEDLYNV